MPLHKTVQAIINSKIYEDRYPKGMKNFVRKWLDTNTHWTIQEQCGPQGSLYRENRDMRMIYYTTLINTFVDTCFEDQSRYKSVRDLPITDRVLVVDCLSWSLGMNPHNGNIYLLQIVDKFPWTILSNREPSGDEEPSQSDTRHSRESI